MKVIIKDKEYEVVKDYGETVLDSNLEERA